MSRFRPMGLVKSRLHVARNRKARRGGTAFSWSHFTLEERTLLSGVDVGMVKDINQIDASPIDLTVLDGKLFFLTKDEAADTESLWASDGTTAGTVELMTSEQFGSSDIDLESATPTDVFVPRGGEVYFLADSVSGSQALFATDGTVAGTTEVTSLSSGEFGFPAEAANLTAAGADLFFTEDYGDQLWVSNGTAAGTTELSSTVVDASDFTTIGNRAYFLASIDGISQVWTSDGTDAGTIQLTDFTAGTDGSSTTLVDLNGVPYFNANDGSGDQLWTTDGTVAGTVAVTDLSDSGGDLYDLQSVNGALYFLVDGASFSGQLWTSDGTAAGTVALTGGNVGIDSVSNFTAVGATTFFVASDYSSTGATTDGLDLWEITGGTASIVTATVPWATGPSDLTALNGTTLLFWADGGNGYGDELWESDGTTSGTVMVKDINPGSAGAYLSGSSETYGVSSGPSGLSQLTVINGEAYFGANDETHGDELWESDGTAAGTALVKDIDPGAASSAPQELTDLNGTLYFVAHDGTGPNQLWESDGSSAGTVLVQSFTPAQTFGADPTNLTAIGGTLFFTADDGIDGEQLWSSDGTANGTTMLTDFASSGNNNDANDYFESLLDFNGKLVFVHNDSDYTGGALYQSDGTAAGTIPIYSGASDVYQPTVVGTSLYFWTNDYADDGGPSLWVISGTAPPKRSRHSRWVRAKTSWEASMARSISRSPPARTAPPCSSFGRATARSPERST